MKRTPTTTRLAAPKNVLANPRMSSWIAFSDDRTVVVRTGKVELGQGIVTALAQLAAGELGVSAERMRPEAARTDRSPNEGGTSGSMSIVDSGGALRYVCRHVRWLLLATAGRQADLPVEELTVTDGIVCHAGEALTDYWKLADDLDLDADCPPEIIETDPHEAEEAASFLPRVDVPDKVFGRARFIHDLTLPEMLHGRVVRPAARVAHLRSVDLSRVETLPGVVRVVADGDFLAVLAEREDQAVRAAAVLADAATWTAEPSLPPKSGFADWLRAQPAEDFVVGETEERPDLAAGAMTATYTKGFTAHASIAPSCGLARFDSTGTRLSVWTHSQSIFGLRKAICTVTGLTPDDVVVQHVEGAGCYGHNPADDAAFEAVLLATYVKGRPVRLQWSRADELGWAPYGPSMVSAVSGRLDPDGSLTDWSYDVWSNGHTSRPGYRGSSVFLADRHRRRESVLLGAGDPPPVRGFGTGRNAMPGYRIPRVRAVAHRVESMPIRTSALRSLGAFMNVFSIESFMDELATAAGIDPLDVRLRNLDDPRGRAVIEAVADRSGWGTPLPGDTPGRGIAYARYKAKSAYCAAVAHVEAGSRLTVKALYLAVDVGRVVALDGVRNQIEGGAIQAMSWTTHEQVAFDDRAVTSLDWETYPIAKFSDIPQLDVHVIPHPPSEPSLGAGEAAQGPVAAAIANALFDAIGVRVRTLPLTQEHIMAALDELG